MLALRQNACMTAGRVLNSLRRYTTIGSVIDTLRNSRIAFVDPEKWDDRNDAEFMRRCKEAKNYPDLKALCCTQSVETYHHWRVFTNSSDGCVIDFFQKPLLASIEENSSYFYAPMQYVTYEKMARGKFKVHDLPFLKRAGFQDELEFRVIYTGESNEDAHFMPIHLDWIGKIVLNPWLPTPIAESIIATLREISQLPDLKVIKSRLINSQRWTGYGKKIVKRGS